MVQPWPTNDMFMSYPPKDGPDPDSVAHFSSLDTYNTGLLKEFHLYLGDKLLCEQAAAYAPFRQLVCLGTTKSLSC